MATRTVINQRALRQHMRTPEPQAALDTATEALVQAIEDESPVQSGYFQDSIRSRRYALIRRIFSIDPFAYLIEWGSKNNMAYAPFRRAARALGFKIAEAEKEVSFVEARPERM
jgi:hypothetical protein